MRPTYVARAGVVRAPVTSQASPRARRTSTTRRAPMNTLAKATQIATRPRGGCGEGQHDGGVDHEGEQAAAREVAAVPGADQHAVQHEDDARDRLAGGGDEQHRHQQPLDRLVVGEEAAEQGAGRREQHAGHDAAAQSPGDHPAGQRAGAGHVARAEGAAGDRLRGDGDGVEGEGQERPDGQRQLVGGEVHLLGAAVGRGQGDGVRRDQQRRPQGQRADHEGDGGVGGGTDAREVGTQRGALAAGGADDDEEQGRGARRLGEHGPEGRAGDAEAGQRAGAEDQEQVEDDVEGVARHRDQKRRPGVLEPAQDPRRGEHDEQRGGAEERDPQVGRSWDR